MWWWKNRKKELYTKCQDKTLQHNTRDLKPALGFSLIEAMIATGVVAIGFVGVYSLVVLSEQFTKWAIARQKLQMQASQMMEIMEADISNIDNYNLDLTNCVDPGAVTTTYLVRGYEWCTRMQDEVGAANGDTRSITITDTGDGKRSINILLEAYGGQAQIVMERVFNAD